MNRLLLSIGCVVWLFPPGRVSAADDEWLGQMVMLKETAAPQIGTRRLNADDVAVPALVEQVNGDWLWLGVAWVKKADAVGLDDAPAYFTKLIDSGRNVVSNYMLRAVSWLSLNEFENAVKDATAALRLEPRNAFLYSLRGTANYGRNASDAALADFDQALLLEPRNVLAMNGRGCALDGKGEFGKSLKQFNDALRFDPRSALLYANRAGTWYDLDEFDKCLADLNRAIQLDPKLAFAYSNRGRWYIRHGEYTKAMVDYNKSIKLAPREWAAYCGLASIYATAPVFEAHIRDGKQALALAKKACDLSLWDDWRPIAALAAAHAELGDFETAARWQTKALSMPHATNDRDRRVHQKRLELYTSGKAYYEEVVAARADVSSDGQSAEAE